VPPQSIEAEQATLGAMLIERAAIEKAQAILKPDDFYREAHQIIFEAATGLSERGEPVDLTTLAADLESRGQLEQAGGRPYLASIFDAVSTAGHIEYYAKIVEERAVLRRLITVGSEIVEACFGDVESVAEVVSRAEAAVLAVSRTRSGNSEFRRLRDMLRDGIERLDERFKAGGSDVIGIPSGLHALDRITKGFRKGGLTYVGGRPGMGKTALLDTIALNAAKRGYKVAQFVFEEDDEEVTERYLAQGCNLSSVRVRTGRFSEEQWRRVNDGAARVWECPLWVYAGAALTPGQLAAKARRQKAEHGIDLLTVDYLQLMHLGRKSDGRTQEVDEISRALKRMATELDVHLMCACQLSREVERRKDPRPVLSDLRESGGIEADANLVLFPYNPHYYNRMRAEQQASERGEEYHDEFDQDGEAIDEVEVIVAKQRGGPVGFANCGFRRNTVQFVNLERDERW